MAIRMEVVTMSADSNSKPNVPTEDVEYLLARARQVDPQAEEGAIRGYLREIAEAEEMLDALELSETTFNVTFSADWEDGTRQ